MVLHDGRRIRLRPITPADGEGLRGFHRRLSSRSVYLRFFSAKPELTDEDVAYFTGVDGISRVALLAIDGDEIVGVGRYDTVEVGVAEVAFVVRDDHQAMGLGTALLDHLAVAARERGIHRFIAEVLPGNVPMLHTFRDAGFAVAQRYRGSVLEVSFSIDVDRPPADATGAG